MTIHNPFAPPSADLTLSPDGDTPIRKPISVWMVQIVGSIVAAVCIYGLTVIGRKAMAGQVVTGFGIPIALHLFIQACFIALLLLMLWQLPKRSRLGRNLGLGLIVFFAVPLAFNILFSVPAKGSAQFVGFILAAVLFEAPLAYWAFALAFSKKARRYFSALRQV